MNTFHLIMQYNLNQKDNIFHLKDDLISKYFFWEKMHNNEFHKIYDSNDYLNHGLKFNFYLFNTTHVKNTAKDKFEFLNSILTSGWLKKDFKEHFFKTFSKIQKTYHVLSRFAFLYKFKKSTTQILTDIYLNPIEMNQKNVITILQNKKKFMFTMTDLVNIINTALCNTVYFFSEPLTIKNPYNNLPFNKSTLYNIYFFIKSSNIVLPILFHNYFLTNFNLKKFQLDYESTIRDIAISKHIANMDKKTIVKTIRIMLKQSYDYYNFSIDNTFPDEILISAFKNYLNLYYLCEYSNDSNKRNYYAKELHIKFKSFFKLNPLFGRKVIKVKTQNHYYHDKFIEVKTNDRFHNSHIEIEQHNNDTESDDENDSDSVVIHERSMSPSLDRNESISIILEAASLLARR